MSNNSVSFASILAKLAMGVSQVSYETQEEKTPESKSSPPPSKDERKKIADTLDTTEKELKRKSTATEDATKLRAQLDKTIEELEKTYTPAAAATEAFVKLAEKRTQEAMTQEADKKAAEALMQQATALREEQKKMKATLDKLKEIQKQAKEDAEKGTMDVNRLKRETEQALKIYFKTADPKMIAERYGLSLDSNFSFDLNTDFMRLTKAEDNRNFNLRYGMGAEHTWVDNYWTLTPKGFKSITIGAVAQHELVTTRMMFDTATELLQRNAKGTTAPVARLNMNINAQDMEKKPEAYKGIFGHPVEAFRPSVINNSTSSSSPISKPETFRAAMDAFTRGEGTRTVKMDNGTVTYGLPALAMPILGNSSGNRNWGSAPDPTIIKNFHPHHMNIGTAEFPAFDHTNQRNPKAPGHIESYSTQNSGVHAVIKRPRWNEDGTPIRVQYLHPKHVELIEENLWRLAGYPRTPTAAELDDETKYPAALVKALKEDKEILVDLIRKSEGSNAEGLNDNLKGTSFSAPTANGVLLAAQVMYPTASKEEIIDAFCSSCVPIRYRQMPDESNILKKVPIEVKDDVTYLVDKKTGYVYSPMAGFGEFIVDKNATKEKPDSWMKMLARLEAMQQERLKLTGGGKRKTTVEVGEGTFKRTVELNGQPMPMTLELDKGKETVTDAMKKTAQQHEDAVMEAFRNVERYNDASIVIDESYPIHQLIKNREYQKAWDELKKGFTPMISENDPYMKEAEAAVKKALVNDEHAYEFNVLPTQDVSVLNTALRVKFKDTSREDRYLILESPDGTRIPMTLSNTTDGVAVTSTPGFMRKPAAGTWKIYTHSPLDMEHTTLAINGTERNPALGIVDVRETVLPDFEKREARHADLPAKNIMTPVTNPHQHLRDMHNPPKPEEKTKPKQVIAPTTRQEFQEYLEEFLKKSNLRKGGFIPEGKLEKVSSRTAPTQNPAIDDALEQMRKTLASAELMFTGTSYKAPLPTATTKQESPLAFKQAKTAMG